jgi:hypothetical protein
LGACFVCIYESSDPPPPPHTQVGAVALSVIRSLEGLEPATHKRGGERHGAGSSWEMVVCVCDDKGAEALEDMFASFRARAMRVVAHLVDCGNVGAAINSALRLAKVLRHAYVFGPWL